MLYYLVCPCLQKKKEIPAADKREKKKKDITPQNQKQGLTEANDDKGSAKTVIYKVKKMDALWDPVIE